MYEQENNKVYIVGEIVSDPVISHVQFGEGFYEFFIKVKRLSGAADILSATLSERLLQSPPPKRGEKIFVRGQFRSYNKLENKKSRLMLTVFICEILTETPREDLNSVILSGYICKPPIYRTTLLNREICDVMLAVNRAHNKADYIPCVAWGRNARFVSTLNVGDMLAVSGRLQSREYQKQLTETEVKTMTAYEVSISKLAAHDRETAETVDLIGDFDLYKGAINVRYRQE